MIPWAKMASDLDLDPAIIRAGRNGREVYLFLLRRCALGDSRGFVAKQHLDPEVLARILMCSPAEAQDGVTACLRESLVVTDNRDMRDGVTIASWEKWNGSLKEPMSVTERKAKSRKIKRESELVTKVTKVTTEKRREEKSRVEILDLSLVDARAHDLTVPIPDAEPDTQIGKLLEHAITRIDAARAELDPNARKIGGAVHVGADGDMLRARLRPMNSAQRQEALDHCLDVLIAMARSKGKVGVGDLRLGMLAGDLSWPRLLGETAEMYSAPRAPPAEVRTAQPLRGAAAARAETARLIAAQQSPNGQNRSQ